MYDLKKMYGSFKGVIGEYMFKLTNKKAVLTRFHGLNKYFQMYSRHFTPSQIRFLKGNWYSIDAIEIAFDNGKMPTIYEIKTKNKYRKFLLFKPKITLASYEVYTKAKNLGFVVKLAIVELAENWEYDVTILDFDRKYLCIDKPKQYDNSTKTANYLKQTDSKTLINSSVV